MCPHFHREYAAQRRTCRRGQSGDRLGFNWENRRNPLQAKNNHKPRSPKVGEYKHFKKKVGFSPPIVCSLVNFL